MIENKERLVDGVQHALNEAFSENIGGTDVLAAICKACWKFDSKLYLRATGTGDRSGDGVRRQPASGLRQNLRNPRRVRFEMQVHWRVLAFRRVYT